MLVNHSPSYKLEQLTASDGDTNSPGHVSLDLRPTAITFIRNSNTKTNKTADKFHDFLKLKQNNKDYVSK